MSDTTVTVNKLVANLRDPPMDDDASSDLMRAAADRIEQLERAAVFAKVSTDAEIEALQIQVAALAQARTAHETPAVDELRRLRKQMGEIAVLLLQNDRDEVMQWARGVKLTFPDGAPELAAVEPSPPRTNPAAPGLCGDPSELGGFCFRTAGHGGPHYVSADGTPPPPFQVPTEPTPPRKWPGEPPHCPSCSCGMSAQPPSVLIDEHRCVECGDLRRSKP